MIEDLNLANLKIGDKIVTISFKGKKIEYGGIRILTVFDDHYKVWRYTKPETPGKNIGAFPLNGYGYYFMSKRKTPDFYYSANPKHIKNARKAHKRATIKWQKEEAEKARKMSLALPIGDLLKTEYYDSEECYHLDTTIDITETLVARLTDDQIITLKEWLNV